MKAMKNILKSAIIVFLLFGIVSCNGPFTQKDTSSGKTTLKICVEDTELARTVTPGSNVGILSDFVVSGKKSDATNPNAPTQELATAETLTELGKVIIEFADSDVGNWFITLSASYTIGEGTNSQIITFSETKTVNIQKNVLNSVSFALKNSDFEYGGMSITIDFKDLNNSVSVVVAALKSKDRDIDYGEKTFSTTDFTTTDTPGVKRIVYTRDITVPGELTTPGAYLPSDTYFLGFTFLDADDHELNSLPMQVHVVNGLTSTASFTMEMNQVYDVEYKYYIESTELTIPDGQTMPDGVQIKNAGVLPGKYSTKGKTPLPDLILQNYVFDGWYDASQVALTNNAIHGGSGTKIVYAKFINPERTVAASGADFTTLSAAISALNELNKTNVNWVIKVSGLINDAVTIDGTHAASFTIEGTTTGSGIDATGKNKTALTVNTTLPLVLKNLKITGGAGENGGGLYIAEDAHVTLDNDVQITGNTAENGGGIYNDGWLYMSDASIFGNIATQDGGGVYNKCMMYMYNGAVIGDASATTAATSTTYSNYAERNGGGIYDAYSGTVYMGYDGQRKNAQTNMEEPADSFTGGVFYNYAGTNGGGLYITDSIENRITLYNGTMSNNAVGTEGLGGAVYQCGYFYIGGSAYIPAGDDYRHNIYLGNNTKGIGSYGPTVSMSGSQEATGTTECSVLTHPGIVAYITPTIYGTTYNTSKPVLGGEYLNWQTNKTLAMTKFAITPNIDISSNTKTLWTMENNNGSIIPKLSSTTSIATITDITIPSADITDAGQTVTATITGTNFNTPGITDYFTATCFTESSIVSDPQFNVTSATTITATLKIPSTADDYSITVSYGSQSKTATFTVGSASQNIVVPSSSDFVTITEAAYYDIPGMENNPVGPNDEYVFPKMQVLKREVTQAEYESFMTYESATYTPTEEGTAKSTTSAYYVSWAEALIYCNLLSMHQGLTPVYRMRLNLDGTAKLYTDPADWALDENSGVCISNGKYYLDPSKVEHDEYDTFSYYWQQDFNDGSHIVYDNAANGYRLPLVNEWAYITNLAHAGTISGMTDNTKNVYEWCSGCNYIDDGSQSYITQSMGTVWEDNFTSTGTRAYVHEGMGNLGFRIIRYTLQDDFIYVEGAQNHDVYDSDYDTKQVFNLETNATGPCVINNLLVQKQEVTQIDYESFMTYTPSSEYIPSETGDTKKTTPAYYVSWAEAIIYCNMLSMAHELTPVYSIKIGSEYKDDPKDWTSTTDIGITIKNSKYYVEDKNDPDQTNYWTPEDFGGKLRINNTANGYRLPTTTEWAYISDAVKNAGTGDSLKQISDNNTKNVNEWCRSFDRYGGEANHYYSTMQMGSTGFTTNNIFSTQNEAYQSAEDDSFVRITAHKGTSNIGFRVVRNAE